MALPSYVVELSFGSSGFIDVTQYVQSVSINRGIDRNLDDFSAGSLSVTFVNNERVFDPLNTSSPLWYGAGGYTVVQPSGRIRVSSNGVRRFTGFVQDWEFSYQQSGFDATATVSALDLIYEIGQVEFANQPGIYLDNLWGIQPVVETTGDRIDRVFNSNGFGASQYALVESGRTIVGADVNNSGDNVLGYMQNLARSEPADFFCNASGVMVMKERNFVDYTWANTTRNNLIAFPGTATAITVDDLYVVAGWLWGGLRYSADPILSQYANAATVDTNLLRYAMQYVDLNKYKYNPDGTATNFTFSAYFRGPGLVTGGIGIFGDLELLDEYAQVLMSTPITANAASALTWTQITVSNNYAGTGVVAGINVRLASSSNSASYFFIADGWLFERASSYTNYFDGSTNPYESAGATVVSVGWSGEAYASYSGLVTSVASTATGKVTRTFADQNSQGTAYGNGTGIPFTDLQITYGSEQLYNEVEVIGVNATATVVDTVSQSLYGLRTYVQTDNLTTDVTKPQQIAEAFRADYRLPEYRANQLSISLESLTAAQQTIVLGVEIRDVIRVCFQPSATGAIVDKYYQILGISGNTDVERDQITFNIASLDKLGFRLDSPFLGILNTDTLA